MLSHLKHNCIDLFFVNKSLLLVNIILPFSLGPQFDILTAVIIANLYLLNVKHQNYIMQGVRLKVVSHCFTMAN